MSDATLRIHEAVLAAEAHLRAARRFIDDAKPSALSAARHEISLAVTSLALGLDVLAAVMTAPADREER